MTQISYSIHHAMPDPGLVQEFERRVKHLRKLFEEIVVSHISQDQVVLQVPEEKADAALELLQEKLPAALRPNLDLTG